MSKHLVLAIIRAGLRDAFEIVYGSGRTLFSVGVEEGLLGRGETDQDLLVLCVP